VATTVVMRRVQDRALKRGARGRSSKSVVLWGLSMSCLI
jgi:hypothetical protein